jgi:hypothetical protein
MDSGTAPAAPNAAKTDANPLSAIVCPLIPRELDLAIRNFATWDADLPPGPPFPVHEKPRFIFSFNCAPDPSIEQRLRDAFEAAPRVRDAFAAMEVRFLDLPPEKDKYIRKPTGPAPKYGYKSGPNWMFYETMKALRGEARFVFLMETDCVPLVPNWLRRLTRTCQRHEDAWVLGAHYSGASPLLWRVARHINGNALYQVGDPEFWTFLDKILWPWMLDYIEKDDPDLAYDCAWEAFLNREEMDYAGHHDWIVSRGVLHKFRLIDTIVNIGGHAEQSGDYVWTRNHLIQRFPAATVAHGPVAQDNAHRRGRYSVGKPRLSEAMLEDGRLVLTSLEATFSRSLWPSAQSFEPGDLVTITFQLRGDPAQIIGVDLREPSGGTIERKRAFTKEDGTRRVKAEFVLDRRFNYISVVFMVLRQTPEPQPIIVEDVAIAVGDGEQAWRLREFMH